jgi:hypothetical protein
MWWAEMHTAALPPCLRIRTPASAASGCVHETIPFVLWTALLLLGKYENFTSCAAPLTSLALVDIAEVMIECARL